MARPALETIRITVRITDFNPAHVRFSIWVQGGLICAPGGLCLRVEEAPAFFRRLRPFKLDVTDDISEADVELVMFGTKRI